MDGSSRAADVSLYALGLRPADGAHALRLPDDSDHGGDLRRQGRDAALAGDRAGRAYVAGIAVMFGALGTLFALSAEEVRDVPGQPVGGVAAGAVLRRDGAVDVRSLRAQRCRRRCRNACRAWAGPGFVGAFLMGLVAGIIAAPCTGPPLAVLLAYVTTTRDAGWGFATLATYGVGIGVPFLLLAAFSMSLPRPGAWMEWVKSVLRHPAVRGRAVLPDERRPGAGAASRPRSPLFALAMLGMIAGRRGAGRDPRQLPRPVAGAGAQGRGRRAG